MLLNPWVIIGAAGTWLLSLVVCGWLMYARGHDDMRNAYTEQQLSQANYNLANAGKNNAKAHDADEKHQTGVQVVHDTTRDIIHTVTLPADADPFLPVGFVRLWDRAASRDIAADPYPGKSDGEPSTVRVSEAQSLLVQDWADKYYACKAQVDDTRELGPVLPPPPVNGTFWDRVNPF